MLLPLLTPRDSSGSGSGRFTAWCISVSGFNTHRSDSEKPGGLDWFTPVPFPHYGSKLRGEWESGTPFVRRQDALGHTAAERP
ncbi:coiled-coil-helix-coiled-coil-helix domain-containing protein 7 isoform X2 [Arvicanthis niloticus]|uniref:coiled-coil-helix-coiled-coil-helix domain-containing protein 7 isoform X2 n=1 Tax=Arvicanthis niloticus TaxID=61156 RepID=UPI00402B3D34